MIFRDRRWESCRRCTTADTVGRWSHRTQGAAVGAALILSAALAVASIGAARSQSLDGIRALQGTFAELALEAEQAAAGFREQMAALQTRAIQQKATIAGLSQASAAAQGALKTPQGLAGTTAQRDAAHALVADMQQAMTDVEDLLETVSAERAVLQRQLRAEARLAAVSGQRDGRRQLERGLQRQLEHLENELARLRAYRDRARLWLEAWVLDSARALEDLVGETGIDVEELIARAADEPVAQGGPLQVAAPDEVGAGAADDGITGDIERLALLQRIATTLPLAAPLDRFTITGEFGKRRDPFTRSWAYHAGLDLGAPRGAKVLAPAPGRVIFAGPSGPYGNLVEIDHGMGIVTRYAHLKSVAVAKGEEVALRTPIGVIGSTGRSTSRHLHYEVRIDDKLLDPARFLDAGRQVASVVEVSDEKTK
jgi:murein DD-endopeptidase MepM/ murein hydrolase activator NlpD